MCGIAAYASLKSPGKALDTTLALLLELQHRGQESVGLAAINHNKDIRVRVCRGTVYEFLMNAGNAGGVLATETSFGAIGHTRYSTSGGYMDSEPQPFVVGSDEFKIAVAFNGTIANYKLLAKELGIRSSRSDVDAFSEAIYRLAIEHGKDVVEALKELSEMVIGGYAVAVLTSEPRLVIAKDPRGFRPLAYAYNDEEMVVASETAALDVLGFSEWTELSHGEIISFDGRSMEVTHGTLKTPTPCAFEYIYISRPDSIFNGINVYETRVRLGYELAKIAPAEADVVIPVPDSGRGAAIGYSRGSGIPIEEGLVINRYLGRGFIMPPSLREIVARLKYGFIKSSISGRRIVLVDDSIVRGTTMAAIALRLKNLGARKVHIRISSPPFMYPCFMGIDIASRKELLAWRNLNPEEIASTLNADSVAFNTVENVVKVIGLPSMCLACFTGFYNFDNLSVDDLENMFSRFS